MTNDQPSPPTRRLPTGQLTRAALEWMEAHPGREWSRMDVSRDIPNPDGRTPELWDKAVGQALNYLAQHGRIGKVKYGRYVYPPELAPPYKKATRGRGGAEEVTSDLRPLTNLPPEVYKDVGLQPVGKAADGSRICVDDQGQVWKVQVVVNARMV